MTTDNVPLILAADPVSAPTVLDLPGGVPVVQIRHEGVAMTDIFALFDSGYSVLAGLGPIGPGFAIYDGDPAGRFDLTIGFPVAGAGGDLPDGVESSVFPTGRALVVSHLGPFDGLPGAWQALMQSPDAPDTSVAIEIYVTDPSQVSADALRTDLVVPLV